MVVKYGLKNRRSEFVSTIYQENIRMDDIDAILAKMNQFNDYTEVTRSTAPFTSVLMVSPEEKGQ